MKDSPSPHGANGKDPRGRFAPGNKLGRGNPHAGMAAKLRAQLFKAIKRADFAEICQRLIAEAKAGNLQAIREVLDRTIGRPIPQDIQQQLDELRDLAERTAASKGIDR